MITEQNRTAMLSVVFVNGTVEDVNAIEWTAHGGFLVVKLDIGPTRYYPLDVVRRVDYRGDGPAAGSGGP